MTTQSVSQSEAKSQDKNEQIQIEGITQPTILQYFTTMNAEAFVNTAALFASDGALHPPFESPITGQDAIAQYLQQEARNMRLLPREGIIEPGDEDEEQIKVSGEVETAYFKVNVAWYFILNAAQAITYVRVKLLASPEELLKMQRESSP